MSDLLTSHKLTSSQIVDMKVSLSLKSMTSKSKLNKKFCIVAGFARPILPSFIVKYEPCYVKLAYAINTVNTFFICVRR